MSLQERIAELEDENEGLRSRRLPYHEAEIAQKRYEDAEAENERLKATTPEQLAEKFHTTYEGAAGVMNYATRPDSAVPWAEVPALNKALMVATCAEVLAWLAERATP